MARLPINIPLLEPQDQPTLYGLRQSILTMYQFITRAFQGVTDGSAAAAGDPGEYVAAQGASFNIPSATPTNLTSRVFSAGDWNIWGYSPFNPTGTGGITGMILSLSLASAAFQPPVAQIAAASSALAGCALNTAPIRFSFTVPTTVYLVGLCTFGASSVSVQGTIYARRVR